MALKKPTAAADQAREVFEELSKKTFEDMPKTTCTVGFRIPVAERSRLRVIFQRRGMTLAAGLKAAVYAWIKSEGL